MIIMSSDPASPKPRSPGNLGGGPSPSEQARAKLEFETAFRSGPNSLLAAFEKDPLGQVQSNSRPSGSAWMGFAQDTMEAYPGYQVGLYMTYEYMPTWGPARQGARHVVSLEYKSADGAHKGSLLVKALTGSFDQWAPQVIPNLSDVKAQKTADVRKLSGALLGIKNAAGPLWPKEPRVWLDVSGFSESSAFAVCPVTVQDATFSLTLVLRSGPKDLMSVWVSSAGVPSGRVGNPDAEFANGVPEAVELGTSLLKHQADLMFDRITAARLKAKKIGRLVEAVFQTKGGLRSRMDVDPSWSDGVVANVRGWDQSEAEPSAAARVEVKADDTVHILGWVFGEYYDESDWERRDPENHVVPKGTKSDDVTGQQIEEGFRRLGLHMGFHLRGEEDPEKAKKKQEAFDLINRDLLMDALQSVQELVDKKMEDPEFVQAYLEALRATQTQDAAAVARLIESL